jgi:hypothetical protein
MCRSMENSECFIKHGLRLGFNCRMNMFIKPGLKSAVLEIADLCRRIN